MTEVSKLHISFENDWKLLIASTTKPQTLIVIWEQRNFNAPVQKDCPLTILWRKIADW